MERDTSLPLPYYRPMIKHTCTALAPNRPSQWRRLGLGKASLLLVAMALPFTACGDDPLTSGGDEAPKSDLATTDQVNFPDLDGSTDETVGDLGPDIAPDVTPDIGDDTTPDIDDVQSELPEDTIIPDTEDDTVLDVTDVTPDITADDGGAETDVPTWTCDDPQTFAPTGSTVDWNHSIATGVLTVNQGKANHRGQDVVTTVDGPQLLMGKFAYGFLDKDLKDEIVEVYIQPHGCGPFVLLGEFLTSEDDEYGTQYPVEDDGGRVFWDLTGEDKMDVGVHPVRMLVKGDHSVAAFNLYVFEPGTQTVIFDIDGTITTSDTELIASLALEIFNGNYVPEMYVDAQNAVQAWVDKGYQVVFLSARPDFLKEMTRDSLILPNFPSGVMHLTNTNTAFISEVAEYKTDFINELKNQGQLDIVAVYGNADTDIEAYEASGIPKDVTFIIGEFAGTQGTVANESYTLQLPWIEAFPAVTIPAPQKQTW